VSVTYSAEDSFVLVVPPGTGATRAKVTFTPHTSTFAAAAYLMPGFAASTAKIATSQRGGRLRPVTRCDFGSEIACRGRGTPNNPVTVTVVGRNDNSTRLAVYIAWA
jgi:hypothetical protein